MKRISTLLLLFFTLSILSQNKDISIIENEVKITSLNYSATNVDDLDDINWNDIKSIFKINKDNEVIKLSFEIDLKESKNKFKGSFTVSGETKNLESLIKKSKKGIKGLKNISKKYNK